MTLEGAQSRIWCSKIGWQTVPCSWSIDGEAALTGTSVHTYGDQPKTGLRTPRLPTSLKVIETDTDRSGTHDFLLEIHSNGLARVKIRGSQWRHGYWRSNTLVVDVTERQVIRVRDIGLGLVLVMLALVLGMGLVLSFPFFFRSVLYYTELSSAQHYSYGKQFGTPKVHVSPWV